MFELASMCIALGKVEKNSLRTMRRSSNSLGNQQNAVVVRTDYLAPPDQRYYDFIFGTPVSLSRQILSRITKLPERAWGMQVKEICQMYEGGDRIDECHIVDRFKWTGRQVMQAERRIGFPDLEEDYGESYQIPEIDPEMFSPDLLHARNQLAVVDQFSCTALLNHIREFSDGLQRELDSRREEGLAR